MNSQTFRTIRNLAFVVCAFACTSILSPGLRAQSTFGSIRGATQDQTGAALPEVIVKLHNEDENTDVSTLSDSSGNFVFQNVKPGHYRLQGAKEGFSLAVVDKVELAARQDIRLDLRFALAATSLQVEVTAAAAAVNTENATLSDSKINADISQLPINSRSVSSSPLAALAVSASVTTDTQGNIAVGGATAAQTGFSVDGISTANVRLNGALADAYPSMENIAEMKVTAFNNNAEFAQIGDVTFVTKGGTNRLHGSAFEYFQDSGLDASVLNFTTKAPRTFNTFGGSLGGPVTIPSVYHGRDKTFFFVDYEGNRKTQSYPEQLLVPSVADRSGNLNDLVAGLGNGPLLNPFTGTAFDNNTIPTGSCPSCINPVAQNILKYYPLPNANLGVLNPSYNYQTLVPTPSNSNGFDIRLDHNITAKQQIYVRFSAKNNFYTEYNDAGVIAPANNFLPNDGANERNRSLVVSYNYSITPTLLNEFRFGFTNYAENDTFPIQGSQAISQLGLVFDHAVNIAAHPTSDAFPTFNFADGSVTSIGQDRVGPTISGNMQFTDNITKILHKHTLRFGVDIRRERFNGLMYYLPSDDFGDFTFSGALTNYSLGDFLLGMPNPSYFAVTGPQMNALTTQWGVYGQDTWQVNSHLTVNAGLRWELLPPFQESNGDIATYLTKGNNVTVVVPDKFYPFIANNPTYQQIYTGFLQGFNACSLADKTSLLPCSNIETASQAGLPQGLRDWNWHDFDPRVSMAWRPFNNNQTVIRAGFGIYTMTTLGPMSFNSGIIALSDLLTFNNSVTNGVAAFQFPQTSPPGAPATLGGGDFEEANNPHWKDPSSAQWNLTVEREVTPNTTVRLSYTGQGGYHLPITIDRNQIPASTTPYNIPDNGYSVVDPRAPFQNWLLLMECESIGNQNYESGIVEFTHRVSRGLTFQANYTFTKNISDAQNTDAPTAYAGEEPYAVEIANAYDTKYDRGNVVGMPTQRFLLTGVYQLPFGQGRFLQGPKFLNPVLGGWNLSTVTTIQSGQWLTATMPAADDQSNTDMIERTTGGAIARPDCIGNPYANQTSQNFFNINAFALPPANAGRFGSCGLGNLQGPGMVNVNMGLAKVFQIGERVRLRFEVTFTNVLNHTNYAPPALNVGNPSNFGVLQSALPQGLGGNRTGQLALRVDF
ncbi:MAG: carboxypeptidase regulatory-like domain-containing protein [Bryobacteraceae bacterium]